MHFYSLKPWETELLTAAELRGCIEFYNEYVKTQKR